MDILRRQQKFVPSSTYDLTLLNNVKWKVEDGPTFLGFSEYLNFKTKSNENWNGKWCYCLGHLENDAKNLENETPQEKYF